MSCHAEVMSCHAMVMSCHAEVMTCHAMVMLGPCHVMLRSCHGHAHAEQQELPVSSGHQQRHRVNVVIRNIHAIFSEHFSLQQSQTTRLQSHQRLKIIL